MAVTDKKIQVLQVDDDLLFGAICARHFEQHDSVELIQETTISGTEKCLAEQPDIDLLMLDLSLPDRDGFEYLTQLAEQKFPGKLVIVSSQPRSVIDMACTLAKNHGLNLVLDLEKPLTSEKLTSLDEVVFSD